jgi:Mrp family chromosome partitioning ATPase
LHHIFGLNLKPGLHEVLHDAVPVSEAIVAVQLEPTTSGSTSGPQSLDVRNQTSGLRNPASPSVSILPAGMPGRDRSELFSSSQISGLLQKLAAQYSYIIIDSPPVLAANDVMNLASSADGVFMVVRASYTSSHMVREALDRLSRCNVKILGVVYNRAAPSTDYYCQYSADYHRPDEATS